jgi:hypothetical protein
MADVEWMAGGSMADVVEELRKEGHVSDAHYVASCRLLEDMRRAHGSSDGIVGNVCERVQTSRRVRLGPPGGGDQDAFDRMMRMLDALSQHERKLLGFLIVQRELPRGSLSDLGRMTSGYQTNKTTRAFAVGRISSLLASIHERYARL